ncbi:hypothetical protein C8Q74DRAFT_1372224 [Fomes fomentarius]|nr:hypothetical protein C8Q74DRAFT_1372224 [Fomes fomentarius]
MVLNNYPAWPTARLPIELQLMVVDQLRHQSSSLSACSLVTRAWLSQSRRHLFREVFLISTRDGTDRFVEFLHFLQATQDTFLYVGKYIAVLNFWGELADSSEEEYPNMISTLEDVYEDFMPLSLETLSAFLPLLPHLVHLSFVHILFLPSQQTGSNADSDVDKNPAIGAASVVVEKHESDSDPALKMLRIEGCSAPHMEGQLFFDIICMFPHIEELVLDSGPWEMNNDAIAGKYIPVIEALELSDAWPDLYGGLTEILRITAEDEQPLTKLILRPGHENQMVEFFEYVFPNIHPIHVVELSVNLFHLLCTAPHTDPLPWDSIPVLPHLPSLHALTFDLDCCLSIPTLTTAVRGERICNALRVYTMLLSDNTRLPALEKVSFHVFDSIIAPKAFRDGARKTQFWHELGDALVTLPSLREVQFVLAGSSDPEAAEVFATVKTKASIEAFLKEDVPQLAMGREEPLYRVTLGE